MMTFYKTSNISKKSYIGATYGFSYGLNTKPYALTGVTSSTNVIPAVAQTITYNSFEKVSSISEPNGSQTINASFTYNSDNQRAKMTVGVYYGAEILTRYYVGGSYMKEVQPSTTNEYTYLGGDAYTAPVVVHNARGVVSYYYLLRDHLGNITHQVNTSNAVVAEFSFDAWGRRRNATNWSYTLDANDKPLFADRGFTGHEYLPWYKLYNMNGRMYDPAVGRFLSADPVVQDAGNTQSYNRYSYCLNNPLKYTDPSGYILEAMDLSPDPDHSAGGGEFANKFGGSSRFDFSNSAAYYRTGNELDVIGTLWNKGGGYWSPSTGFEFFTSDISFVIYGGTTRNRYETLRGIQFTDGSEYYFGDEASFKWNVFMDKGLNYAGKTNDFVDAFAKTLGVNGLTALMVNGGKTIGRYTLPAGIIINTGQIFNGVRKDNFTYGYNAQKSTTGAVGGIVGAWTGFQVGAWAGFEAGFTIGLAFEGVGAIPGAVIGGILGGFVGAWGGAYGGSKLGESLISNKVQ